MVEDVCVAVCPSGQTLIGGVCIASAVVEKCEGTGWSLSAAEGSCGILVTLSGGAASDKCYFSGSTSPQCEEVFGSTVHYFPSPILAADEATTLHFIYDCDPNGRARGDDSGDGKHHYGDGMRLRLGDASPGGVHSDGKRLARF